MNTLDQARSILTNNDLHWVELDLNFDVATWKQESQSVDLHYQEYRESESTGWASCCLHGLDYDKPYVANHYGYDEYTAPYKFTSLAKGAPTITDFWKNQFPAEKYTRLRFMKVAPGGRIGWHNDGQLPEGMDPLDAILPINVAITHPSNCTMQIENKIVPWEDGKSFLLNIRKDHAVVNHSSKSRIHMIANVIVGNRKVDFAEMIVRCYKKQYG
jgi:hypothetical protein